MFTLDSSELEMRNERLAGQGEEKHEGEAGGGLHLLRELVFLHSAHQFPNFLINVNCQYMTIHRQGAFPSMGETSWPSKAYASKTSFLRCLLTTLVVSYLYKRQYSLQLKANLWIEAATKSERQKGFLWQESLTSSPQSPSLFLFLSISHPVGCMPRMHM